MKKYLVIDVGGTNLKHAIINDEAEILSQGEVPTPTDSIDSFVAAVVDLYNNNKDVEGVAMSAPGKIDSDNGYFYTGGALTWLAGVNLAEKLKESIPVPFSVENDGKCAGYAELWKGNFQDTKNGLVLVLGTGIGGCIVIDGKVYKGSTWAAGELSGFCTDITGKKYEFGKMWAMTGAASSLVKLYANKIGVDPKETNGRLLFDAANAGDEVALESVKEFSYSVAMGIMSLQFALDVEKVLIGGGISRQPLLIKTIAETLDEVYGNTGAVMPATMPKVEAAKFANDSNLLGALYHHIKLHA